MDNKQTTSSRLIALAVSLVGDAETVRQHIKCIPTDFNDCCSGATDLTPIQLDSLISLIIHEQGLLIAKNRELKERARELMEKARDLMEQSKRKT